MYQEIQVPLHLEHLVDAFWTFSSSQKVEAFKIFPDSCTDLIFDLEGNQAFVSGVMTKFQVHKLEQPSNLIGIRFKTENFGRISNVPAVETRNQRLEVKDVLPNFRSSMMEQLNACSSIENKLLLIARFVAHSIHLPKPNKDRLLLQIAQQIRSSSGKVNIKALAKTSCLSLRQLERRFKKSIGLSPKEFASIVRFRQTKQLIAQFPKKNIQEIAYDMGFFDPAHLSNEFKRIAGENPSYFR